MGDSNLGTSRIFSVTAKIRDQPEPVPRARGTARGARGARWQRETGRTSCASRTWKNSLSGRLEKSSMEGRTIYYAQILRPSLCASLSGDLSPSSTLPCDCSCWCSPPTQQPALKRSSSTRTRTVWRKVPTHHDPYLVRKWFIVTQ